MQTSTDPREWSERPREDNARSMLSENSDPALKRELFPLSGRFLGSSSISYMEKGTLLKYVRTKLTPAILPIQALISLPSQHARVVSLYPDEIELLRPFEDS